MRRTIGALLGTIGLIAQAGCNNPGSAAPAPLTETKLLRTDLEPMERSELIMTRVTIPPHTTLPWHFHHGPEIVMVEEGSVVTMRRGKPDLVLEEGDIVHLKAGEIHTARTDEESVTGLVVRVHAKGEPERVTVE